MTVQEALCQIKLQGTYSSAMQHCMSFIEWFWGREKLESYFGNKPPRPPPPPPPTLCLGIYKCIPLGYHQARAI